MRKRRAILSGAAPFPRMTDRAQLLHELEELAPSLWLWLHVHIRAPLRRTLDPEDAMQEITCRALDSLERFDPERGSLRAWLFGIARNLLREALRRNQSAPGTLTTGTQNAIPEAVTTICRRLAREETHARLRQLVDEELSEEERRLLLYRGLEGRSHPETAELLGLDARVVAKRWERLRRRLEARFPDPPFAS